MGDIVECCAKEWIWTNFAACSCLCQDDFRRDIRATERASALLSDERIGHDTRSNDLTIYRSASQPARLLQPVPACSEKQVEATLLAVASGREANPPGSAVPRVGRGLLDVVLQAPGALPSNTCVGSEILRRGPSQRSKEPQPPGSRQVSYLGN